MSNYVKKAWTDKVVGVSPGTPVDATNLNNLENAVDSLRKFPPAGGTGTAITVTDYKFWLEDKCALTFIASASNAAAATTIAVNAGAAKPVYKPGGTDAPNFISGKAYTVWYDSAGGNFFVKASAEGDATAANVLATKIFSSDEDTGLIGTMPNNAGDVAAVSAHMAGTVIHIVPATGYTDGSDDATIIDLTTVDADLAAANIMSGKNIFGVDGTAKRRATGAASVSGNALTISGLAFRPAIVIAGKYYNPGCFWAVYAQSLVPYMEIRNFLDTDIGAINWTQANSTWTIADDGFKVEGLQVSGMNANWIAFE